MTEVMRFDMQGLVLTTNKVYGLYYQERAREVKHWRTLAAEVSGNRLEEWKAIVGREPVPCKVKVRPVTPRACLQDTGACMPTAKACIDGLVDAGYWPDDSPKWIKELSFLPQEKDKAWDKPGVQLWIYSLI